MNTQTPPYTHLQGILVVPGVECGGDGGGDEAGSDGDGVERQCQVWGEAHGLKAPVDAKVQQLALPVGQWCLLLGIKKK